MGIFRLLLRPRRKRAARGRQSRRVRGRSAADAERHPDHRNCHLHPAYRYWQPVYPAYYVVAPPVQVAPAYTITPTTCRVFQGDAVIDQSQRPFFGRACLYADGRWHIVD
ncbi:MAG: hypothetical protein EXQ91_03285 [Alphaproteobacteria bacterium]|nr:hypothetical protein [Alphaproteobacteria bacterium]